jgi:hypothetical protein
VQPNVITQGRCETGLGIGELFAFLSSLAWVSYYAWLLNSLVCQFEANEGAELKANDGGEDIEDAPSS